MLGETAPRRTTKPLGHSATNCGSGPLVYREASATAQSAKRVRSLANRGSRRGTRSQKSKKQDIMGGKGKLARSSRHLAGQQRAAPSMGKTVLRMRDENAQMVTRCCRETSLASASGVAPSWRTNNATRPRGWQHEKWCRGGHQGTQSTVTRNSIHMRNACKDAGVPPSQLARNTVDKEESRERDTTRRTSYKKCVSRPE